MKSDILFGIIVGSMIGITVATYCKGAQKMVKKGTQMVKQEAENILNKAKENFDEEDE